MCGKSGWLAKEKVPSTTHYGELATKEQMPTGPCNGHGDARTRIVHDLPDAGVPRAALVVDTNQVKAVAVKGPTLLADSDPYHAVHSTVKPPKPAEPAENEVKAAIPVTPTPASSAPENDPTILRAEPVRRGESEPPAEEEEVLRAEPILRAEPAEPSTTPPPQSFSAPLFASPTPAHPGNQ